MRAAATLGAIRRAGRVPGGVLTLPLIAMLGTACAALAFVVYVLWPRWPDVPAAPDAAPLPIVIGDVVFQVPPAAIRMKVQRRPGTQDRIDLAYQWPTLTPGSAAAKAGSPSAGPIFASIAAAPASALAPTERLRSIYPRYAEATPSAGPNGLVMMAFRSGSPYQGEDLLLDTGAPDRFFARCSRDKGPIGGTCLTERFVGNADITLRFPRAWLGEWRELAAGIDRLIASWQPSGG